MDMVLSSEARGPVVDESGGEGVWVSANGIPCLSSSKCVSIGGALEFGGKWGVTTPLVHEPGGRGVFGSFTGLELVI